MSGEDHISVDEFEVFRGSDGRGDDSENEHEGELDHWRTPREFYAREGKLSKKERVEVLESAGVAKEDIILSTQDNFRTIKSRKRSSNDGFALKIIDGADVETLHQQDQEARAAKHLVRFAKRRVTGIKSTKTADEDLRPNTDGEEDEELSVEDSDEEAEKQLVQEIEERDSLEEEHMAEIEQLLVHGELSTDDCAELISECENADGHVDFEMFISLYKEKIAERHRTTGHGDRKLADIEDVDGSSPPSLDQSMENSSEQRPLDARKARRRARQRLRQSFSEPSQEVQETTNVEEGQTGNRDTAQMYEEANHGRSFGADIMNAREIMGNDVETAETPSPTSSEVDMKKTACFPNGSCNDLLYRNTCRSGDPTEGRVLRGFVSITGRVRARATGINDREQQG